MALSELQVAKVADYLLHSGVENPRIYADLLNHLCCMIEQNMETTFSSRTALMATIPFALFGIGWVRNFPRWSVPAIGFCVLFSLFLMMGRIPGISDERLGMWALIPILTTLAICCICRPSFAPAKHFLRKIKDEPALY
jgi:hypothetical protein